MVSDMATWDDVRRLALALPQTVEGSSREGVARAPRRLAAGYLDR
jgi:hypothetical protein